MQRNFLLFVAEPNPDMDNNHETKEVRNCIEVVVEANASELVITRRAGSLMFDTVRADTTHLLLRQLTNN